MSSTIRLEDRPDVVTEWSSANNIYRFAYVAPGEWDVHRAHDIGYVAHLRRDGDFYDFRGEDGNPVASGRTLTLGELEDLLL